MKKLENFCNCLETLKTADFELAQRDDIYKTGVIGQFNLTFELSWKALQGVMKLFGVAQAETGSPGEILLLAYKFGFIDNEAVWLKMLKKRNTAIHIYNEGEIDEMLREIKNDFIPVFEELREGLEEKIRQLNV